MPLMVAQHFMIPAGAGQFRYAAGETLCIADKSVENLVLWGQGPPSAPFLCWEVCASCISSAELAQTWVATAALLLSMYDPVPGCCQKLTTNFLIPQTMSSWAMALLCSVGKRASLWGH